jgi:hypothetical protein
MNLLTGWRFSFSAEGGCSMSYETKQYAHSDFDLENSRSADYMATFFLVVAVIWLIGAALMFGAAVKGSTIAATPVTEAAAAQEPGTAAVAPAAQ